VCFDAGVLLIFRTDRPLPPIILNSDDTSRQILVLTQQNDDWRVASGN